MIEQKYTFSEHCNIFYIKPLFGLDKHNFSQHLVMGCWIPVQFFLHCTLRSGSSYLITLATVMQPTEPWTATRLTSIVLLYLYLNSKSQRDQLLHCLKQDLLAWYTTVMSFMLQIYRYGDNSK